MNRIGMFKSDQSISEHEWAEKRRQMVTLQLSARGIRDKTVLDAMRTVPRHFFVPKREQPDAYADGPLSIGCGQTISQPYVVASMTEHLHLTHKSRVLEIGTGCGYQTAVLAEIAAEVYTVEIIKDLADRAKNLLSELRYHNVHFHVGNGSEGWPAAAPFDAILVAAAAPRIPPLLLEQLIMYGIMVLPLERGGLENQELVKLTKTPNGMRQESLYQVRFVPLTGGISES